MSEYDFGVRGPLKLKGDSGIKKKKKKKDDKKLLEQVSKSVEVESSKKNVPDEVHKTKAELAFLKQQEKMQEERIKKKAAMTHKQRVEEFNRHLDSLTEHFDIPKISKCMEKEYSKGRMKMRAYSRQTNYVPVIKRGKGNGSRLNARKRL